MANAAAHLGAWGVSPWHLPAAAALAWTAGQQVWRSSIFQTLKDPACQVDPVFVEDECVEDSQILTGARGFQSAATAATNIGTQAVENSHSTVVITSDSGKAHVPSASYPESPYIVVSENVPDLWQIISTIFTMASTLANIYSLLRGWMNRCYGSRSDKNGVAIPWEKFTLVKDRLDNTRNELYEARRTINELQAASKDADKAATRMTSAKIVEVGENVAAAMQQLKDYAHQQENALDECHKTQVEVQELGSANQSLKEVFDNGMVELKRSLASERAADRKRVEVLAEENINIKAQAQQLHCSIEYANSDLGLVRKDISRLKEANEELSKSSKAALAEAQREVAAEREACRKAQDEARKAEAELKAAKACATEETARLRDELIQEMRQTIMLSLEVNQFRRNCTCRINMPGEEDGMAGAGPNENDYDDGRDHATGQAYDDDYEQANHDAGDEDQEGQSPPGADSDPNNNHQDQHNDNGANEEYAETSGVTPEIYPEYFAALETLGLDHSDWDIKSLRTAFKKAALANHSDKHPGNFAEADEIMKQVNWAHTHLVAEWEQWRKAEVESAQEM